MANKTVSNLNELTTVSNSDVLLVETETETLKVTKGNLLKEVNEQLNAKSNASHTHDEYVTENELNSKGLATETFVTNKIAEASLSGGDVDLSGYATIDFVTQEINSIELIPGPKGDKGDKGEQGPKGDKGEPGTTSWAGIIDKPTDLATQTFVIDEISKAQLGGGATGGTAEDCVKHHVLDEIPIFTNVSSPLDITTFEGSQNQPIHPKVLYFEDGWNGYKFWMAYSPYPGNDDDYEDPCIAVSNDGVNWIDPPGLTNPLRRLTPEQYARGDFHNDPHLVMVGDTMECWFGWRATGDDAALAGKYKMTSTDGVNWTEAVKVNFISNIVSNCMEYENGRYKTWAVDATQRVIKYAESTDNGETWINERVLNITFPEATTPWHMDIIYHDGKYRGLFYCDNDNDCLCYSESKDNINWTDAVVVLKPSENGWDDKHLYRSSFVNIDGVYYLYYTGVSSENVWKIGLSKFEQRTQLTNNNKNINPITIMRNVFDDYGNDLLTEIKVLKQRITALEAGNNTPTVSVQGISLSKSTHTMQVGDTLQLTATISPSDATNKNVLWKVNNSNCSVTNKGLVTGVIVGRSIITCTTEDGGYAATCVVEVTEETSISNSEESFLNNFAKAFCSVPDNLAYVSYIEPNKINIIKPDGRAVVDVPVLNLAPNTTYILTCTFNTETEKLLGSGLWHGDTDKYIKTIPTTTGESILEFTTNESGKVKLKIGNIQPATSTDFAVALTKK